MYSCEYLVLFVAVSWEGGLITLENRRSILKRIARFKRPLGGNSRIRRCFALLVSHSESPVLSRALLSMLTIHSSRTDRIRTILSYDKILVMSAGSVAEFDTPRNLFMKEDGIFRSMCGKSSIGLEDVDAAEKMR